MLRALRQYLDLGTAKAQMERRVGEIIASAAKARTSQK
jgi:hypothetical protein